jgi:hypothetical protein
MVLTRYWNVGSRRPQGQCTANALEAYLATFTRSP